MARWYHRGQERTRGAIIDALARSRHDRHHARARRLSLCCCGGSIALTPTAAVRCVPHACRDRLCPRCQARRSRKAAERAAAIITQADSPRLITLTMPATTDGLADVLARLRDALRRLRRLEDWRARVTGGMWVVEITRGQAGQHWHVHAHIVADGGYFPVDALRAAWRTALNNGPQGETVPQDAPLIVDIRAVRSRQAAAQYLAKYIGKPQSIAAWHRDEICEYADATKGARTIQTFGTWHGQTADPKQDENNGADLRTAIDIHEVAWDAAQGSRRAASLLSAVVRRLEVLRSTLPVDLLPAPCEPLDPDTPLYPRDLETWNAYASQGLDVLEYRDALRRGDPP